MWGMERNLAVTTRIREDGWGTRGDSHIHLSTGSSRRNKLSSWVDARQLGTPRRTPVVKSSSKVPSFGRLFIEVYGNYVFLAFRENKDIFHFHNDLQRARSIEWPYNPSVELPRDV